MSWRSRLMNVFRPARVQRELDDELRFHVAERIEALMQEGRTRPEAEAEAVRRLGHRLLLREASRDVKIATRIESLLQDVRFGLRVLRKDAVLTTAAVASLALAIGACVAAFSLIEALILRPLPVHAPDRLVTVAYLQPSGLAEHDSFNYPLFQRLRDAGRPHVDLFAVGYSGRRAALFPDAGGQEERVGAHFVSGDMFPLLGITPALGRLLSPADDVTPGAHAVAVLSHAFWMRRFGGDPTVIGRTFTFHEHRFQIVGVARAGFTGTEPGFLTDVWVPTMMWSARALGPQGAEWSWFRILGRLKPGVRAEQAQAVLQATFTAFRLERSRVTFRPDEPRDRVERYLSTPLRLHAAANGTSPLRRRFERPLAILAIVVVCVLLIASSNVANLLVARAAAREREMSLRVSIGAGRGRLIQQVLVESALLAVAASAAGLILAGLAAPAIVDRLAPSSHPAYLDLRLNGTVLAFAAGIGLLTTILFGLAPALRASSVAPMGALQRGGGRLTSRLALRPLLALQVAFSLVVLFVASLLLVSFVKLARVDPGFLSDRLLVLSLDTRPIGNDPEKARVAGRQLLDRVRQMPGVERAALAGWPLFEGSSWTAGVRVPGRAPEAFEPNFLPISDGFLETMRIRLLAGRTFTPRDAEPAFPTTVLVNEAFARRYFDTLAPIDVVGRTFGRPLRGPEVRSPVVRNGILPQEIVGVVTDAKYETLQQPAPPTVYVPLSGLGALHVRTAGADPLALAPVLQHEIPREPPGVRVTDITLQSTLIANTILGERLLALLSAFFAGVGLLLAGVGLYGVLSYGVVQRTREIGIRVALGAQPRVVVRTVLAHVGGVLIAGTIAGVGGGLLLSRLVRGMLYDVQPLDALSLALPVAALLLVAVLAAVPPARRAARVDPVVALRHQ